MASVLDGDIERWRYDLELNLCSVFYGIEYFAPLMQRRGGGMIIFTGNVLTGSAGLVILLCRTRGPGYPPSQSTALN